jgi:hypothetical protein
MRSVLLLMAAVCFAQPAPENSAITGRVVSAATGAPLKKASVWLESFTPSRGVNNGPTVPPVTTDADGRFTLAGLAPGSYLLLAKRNGYLDQGYGAATPEVVGPPLELAPGEAKRDLVVKLTPQSLLYGKVVDEDGDPVPSAQISVLRVSYAGGHRHLVEAGSGASQDDGSFVVGSLTPGRYYVNASVRQMDQPRTSERYVPTYYPSAADAADVSPVELAAGSEIRGLAIRLRKARVYRIRGRVTLPEHFAAPGGLDLRLVPGMRGVHSQQDGSFEFEGVPPGAYAVETNRFLSGRVSVTVADADLDGVVLPLGPGPEVTGKLRGADRGAVSLTPVGRPPDSAAHAAVEHGSFYAGGLLPLSYTVSVDELPEGSYVKSMTFAGRPVVDWTLDLSSGAGGELVIDVSPEGGEVTGKVERPGAIVQIWPAGGESAKSVRADAHGEFRFHSLAPGDYRVLAWEDLDDDLAQYAPFRARFETDAATVHVGERGHERVEPKLIGHDAIAAEAAKLK